MLCSCPAGEGASSPSPPAPCPSLNTPHLNSLLSGNQRKTRNSVRVSFRDIWSIWSHPDQALWWTPRKHARLGDNADISSDVFALGSQIGGVPGWGVMCKPRLNRQWSVLIALLCLFVERRISPLSFRLGCSRWAEGKHCSSHELSVFVTGAYTFVPWLLSFKRGRALEEKENKILVKETGYFFIYGQVGALPTCGSCPVSPCRAPFWPVSLVCSSGFIHR